jgi:hypothetical protein
MKSLRLPCDITTESFLDVFNNTAAIPIEVWDRRK